MISPTVLQAMYNANPQHDYVDGKTVAMPWSKVHHLRKKTYAKAFAAGLRALAETIPEIAVDAAYEEIRSFDPNFRDRSDDEQAFVALAIEKALLALAGSAGEG